MSFLYLPELEADCSQVDCLAGEPSAPSRSTNTASKFCSNGSETECSTDSPSGTTLEHSTGDRGAVESMSLPPDFLASLSALLDSSEEKPTNATDGQIPRGYSAKFDRDTRCWRTSQRSLLADTLEPFSEIWSSAGLVTDGRYCPLPDAERLIFAKDSGLLPTPTDASKGGGSSRSGDRIDEIPTLQGMARSDKWPTPANRDYRFPNKKSYAERGGGSKGEQLPNAIGGPLNPNWVEWLMGWPIGWTALEPLATDRFQLWRAAHGAD